MRIALTIVLALFLPLSALMVVLSEPVCRLLAETSIAQTVNDSSTQELLVDVAMGVRDYSLGNNEADLPLGENYREAITPDALSHLLDVRTVFLACEFTWAILLILLVFLLIATRNRKGVYTLAKPLFIGGIVPLAAAALLGIAIVVDFSAFFTWMHGIFFADGSWTFPADSLLIRSLPFNFWMTCAGVWAGCMAVFCAISIVIGIVLRRRTSEESAR